MPSHCLWFGNTIDGFAEALDRASRSTYGLAATVLTPVTLACALVACGGDGGKATTVPTTPATTTSYSGKVTATSFQSSVSGDPTGLVKKLAASNMPLEKRIEHLFLAALARQPSPREQQAALQLVRTSGDNQATALEDVWWALQNSSECVLDR